MFLAAGAEAQTFTYAQNKPAADKIAAIVGDKIILESEIESAIIQAKEQGATLPPDAKCITLGQMMTSKALVLQAEIDSLPASDDEVNARIENKIRYFLSLYGSQQKMEEETGLSIYQIRDRFRDPIKEGLLAEAMQRKIVDGVKITPSEVISYYNKIPKDSLRYYESEVEVGQIVLKPKPSKEVVQYTIDQLNEFRKEVQSGEKSFQVLANLYSKDLGTGSNILTIDRTQNMYDPDFVAAAFRLKEGEISPVVKSQFGYHIIQLVSREGDIVKVRHILQIPPITPTDMNATIQKMDSIRADIVEGKTTFGQAATQYSDDDNIMGGTKSTGGMFTQQEDGSTYLTIDQLDKGIVLMLDTMKIGEISGPVTFSPDPRMPENKYVRIVYLKSRTQPHRENLQDDYSKIQDRALKEKQAKAMNKWFNDHMPSFYLKVDDEYKDCNDVQGWVKDSDAAGRKNT